MHSLPKAASMWKRKQYEEATKAVQTMFNHIKKRADFDYGFHYAFGPDAKIIVTPYKFTLMVPGHVGHSVDRNKEAGKDHKSFTGR
ncbi:hypothetical protein JNZ24_10780 [Streptococcus suis]|nr:hypothetical protein [Streptococcus suis]